MKNKLLIVLLSSLLSSQVSAGVPVIEATSVIFQPLQYMEQLQTQLNTINQYEQMILDYENQIKQLQNIVVNTRFDNIKITNLQDLQNALNLAKSRYLAAIQQYNSIATKTNKLTDDGCDFLNKVELCSKEQQETLQELSKELKEQHEKLMEDNNPNIEGTTANTISVQKRKLDYMYGQMANLNPETTGTNQFLSNSQELQHFSAEQLLKIQDQNQEIKTAQKDYFLYQRQKDVKDQEIIQKKFRSAESRAWRTNKVYKDHY